ncbi:MAG: 16S rRNA (guanine(527)-N(7))-methyltransferase RsmG [Oscillospiraceae bacterium]|nr:16S rRNA (guanine(527)-N(7))-methyltransferase RsmG [Oscillospiraceae bacterium]
MSFPDVLSEGAKTLGIEISEAAQELLARYGAELEEYNKNVNLTAITGQDEIARLHFVDSLSVAAAVELKGKKAIDIGSGGGFPGLPLKIFEPGLDMTTVDSVGKKVDFMNHIGSMLELEGFVSHTQGQRSLASLPSTGRNMTWRYQEPLPSSICFASCVCPL